VNDGDARGRELELPAGKTVVAEFKLQKQGGNAASDDKNEPQENAGRARGRAEVSDDTQAAAQLTIEAHVADSSGKALIGQRMFLTGRSSGENYETFADSDDNGTIVMDVPRGIQQLSLSLLNANSETIARFGPSNRAHLRLNGRLEGIDLFEDWKGIEITHYRCPTLLVKAVDQNGKIIDGFKPELTYFSTPANAVRSIRGHRGDVYFAKVSDGRWRSEQLIPSKEFTLAVTAPGYRASFEKLSLREAEVKELTVTLAPGIRSDQLESTKDIAEKGRPATRFVNSSGIKFALIPAGEFTMGSPEDEEDRPPMIGSVKNVEEMQHTVRITRPFYMSICEVTQEQYEAVMGTNPSQYSPQGTHKDRVKNRDTKQFPVENVRWFEANEFCKRISAMEGKICRLPTEAEWEYACRAGTTTVFSFGDTFDGTQANIDGAYPRGIERKGNPLWGPTTVGAYKPNAFGLYDMHGNVWEWCSDLSASGYYAFAQRDDPPGPPITAFNPHFVKEETYNRSARGGAFYLEPNYCRSASRAGWEPNFPRNHINRPFGIRLVCELPRENND
jgi:formylglycine-generating enzyme required for sulfatase activity